MWHMAHIMWVKWSWKVEMLYFGKVYYRASTSFSLYEVGSFEPVEFDGNFPTSYKISNYSFSNIKFSNFSFFPTTLSNYMRPFSPFLQSPFFPKRTCFWTFVQFGHIQHHMEWNRTIHQRNISNRHHLHILPLRTCPRHSLDNQERRKDIRDHVIEFRCHRRHHMGPIRSMVP